MSHATQNALATLRAAEWIPITAVRVLIGIFFCISGGTKLLSLACSASAAQFIEGIVPFPQASASFVSLSRSSPGGAGLALGLLTPFCALVLGVDMIVALATNWTTRAC